jgi:hypothetical protein
MASDNLAAVIFQFGVRSLESPTKTAIGAGTASIDLRPGGMGYHNDTFGGMCGDRIRDFGWRYFFSMGQGGTQDQPD